jgi:hypothetical protein
VSKGMPDRNWWIVVAMIFLWIMIANKYAYKIWDRIWYNKTWIFSTIIQWIMLIITGLFLHSWRSIILMLICFYLVDWVRAVVRNHVLVEQSNGIAIATTRSVIISLTALYVASWRYIYWKLPVEYGLIIGGLVILIINILLAKQILQFKKP